MHSIKVGVFAVFVVFVLTVAYPVCAAPPPTKFLRNKIATPSPVNDVVVLSERKDYLVMLVNLLGHFHVNVKHYLVDEIDDGAVKDAKNSDLLFFISDNNGRIPDRVLNLMIEREGDFCFVGNDLYLLLKRKKYPITYNGVIDSYDYVEYRGRRYFNDGRSLFFSSYTMKGGRELSFFTDGSNRAVYIGKVGNMWIITNPTLYGYSTTGLILADALHDILKREHVRVLRAIIRLEDVNPSYDAETLKKTLSYLYSRHLPFAMIFYLVYVDFAHKEIVTLSQRPDLVELLKEADENGATLILHGVTHQYRKVEISGEGSEFWDIEKNTMIPDFSKYFDERMRYAITVARKLKIPFKAFEAPHYNLPLIGQKLLKRYFPVYVGQVMVNNSNYKVTQQFPYFIYRSYTGLFIVPENLGYISLHKEKQSVDSILAKARLLKSIVRDPVAGFFFHPFVGVNYLKEVVDGLENMGYNFVDLKNIIPAYQLPKVKPISINEIGMPFDIESVTKKSSFNLRILMLGILLMVIALSVAYIFRMYRNKKRRWM